MIEAKATEGIQTEETNHRDMVKVTGKEVRDGAGDE